jgi:hypothetical protein
MGGKVERQGNVRAGFVVIPMENEAKIIKWEMDFIVHQRICCVAIN